MADLKKHKVYKNNRFEVLTDSGFQDFQGIIIGENTLKHILEFHDGSKLICTPKHKIIKNDIIVYAKNLKVDDIISNKKLISNTIIKNNDKVYELLHVTKHKYFVNNILSHQCLLIDEAAHIDRFKEDEFVKSIMPVISSSSQTKIFMISTPNGTSNHFYKIYSGAERGDNGWYPEKIDWQEVPGRDEKWKQKAVSDLGSIEAFDQEYGNKFIETGETAIDKEIIAEFRSMVRKPEIFDTPELKVWETPDPKAIYIIGADVSDGVGGAASCLQGLNITDLTNIKQAFKYSNRFIDTAHFALEINNIAKSWGKPFILLERNSMGGEVINFLQRQPYNYERLVGYDAGQLQYEKLGIYSSTNVKYEGVSNMRYWINSLKAVSLFDITTVQELETFVKYPNGTWKHQPSEGILDDHVMALLWALFGLHTPIAESIFEISQYDDRGKPLKIRKSYYDDDNNFYGLNQYRKDWSDQDFVPAFISTKASQDTNPEMEDLAADGWKLLSNI